MQPRGLHELDDERTGLGRDLLTALQAAVVVRERQDQVLHEVPDQPVERLLVGDQRCLPPNGVLDVEVGAQDAGGQPQRFAAAIAGHLEGAQRTREIHFQDR